MGQVSTDLRDKLRLEGIRHLQRYRSSVALLNRNYRELTSVIRHLTAPTIAHRMAGDEDRWHRQESMAEVIYLLHNYVASAKSLVDHTRRIYNKLYCSDNLIPEYESEIRRRFVDHPLVQFVEDLREMAQHYRLPSIAIVTSMVMTPVPAMTISVRLDRADLLEYDGWGSAAKGFLAESDASLDVLTLVASYHGEISHFQQWFQAAQASIHRNAPELIAHLLLHGVLATPQLVTAEIERRVSDLISRDKGTLTFADLHNALLPGLTIWDSRTLDLCQHDSALWADLALAAIAERFELSDAVRAQILGFIAPDV